MTASSARSRAAGSVRGLWVVFRARPRFLGTSAPVLCGAFEGALPAGPGGDAILDDRVWQSLKAEHPFTEDAMTRIQRARESAERAIGAVAGGQLTWSAPCHEAGGARGYYPSPMMAEAYSAVAGHRVTASQLLDEASSEAVAHPGSALGSMMAGPVVDVAELRLRDAVSSAQAGAAIGEDDPLARPLALLRARRSRVLTEWDGNVAEIDGDLLIGSGRTVSPTSLEAYGACGYKYFARSVLRLNVVDEPDEREMMDAAERGSVIHRVLERFFLFQQERGRPAANETWTPAWSGPATGRSLPARSRPDGCSVSLSSRLPSPWRCLRSPAGCSP